MELKEGLGLLFKPDWRRLLLAIFLGIFYYYFWYMVFLFGVCEECNGLYGYPLPVSISFSSFISEEFSLPLSIAFLLIDVYIIYLLSCELVLVYDIAKGRVR